MTKEPVIDQTRNVADSLLLVHADLLDDIESARIAHENRIRSLTSTWEVDGVTYGKGIPADLPEVQPLIAELEQIKAREHHAELMLKRALRLHPLHGWVKRTVGVGEKQAARLLACIDDPASRYKPSQLWAYCGLHVDHPGQVPHGTQSGTAGDDPTQSQTALDTHIVRAAGGVQDQAASQQNGDNTQAPTAGGSHPTDHSRHDHQTLPVGGVAPKRRRGQQAKWNTTAGARIHVIAESCIKQRASPYRQVYDDGRVKYADAVHQHACERCGPSGNPAKVGSPLSDGHKHARALRLVKKQILLDLWREARGGSSETRTSATSSMTPSSAAASHVTGASA